MSGQGAFEALGEFTDHHTEDRGAGCVKVLVWGGTGYVGAHVIHALRESGHQVTSAGFLEWESVEDPQELFPDDVVNVDVGIDHAATVADEILATVPGPFDAVFFPGIDTFSTYTRPRIDEDRLRAESAALESLIGLAPRYFVLTSYASVYSPDAPSPITEDAPLAPVTDLGRHSLELEQRVARAFEGTATAYAILRCASLGGKSGELRTRNRVLKGNHLPPGFAPLEQDFPSVTFSFSEATDPSEIRDVLHFSDAATAHARTLAALEGRTGGLVMNVGSGVTYTGDEFIEVVERYPYIEIVREPASGPTVAPRYLSTRLLQETTGWRPRESNRVPTLSKILTTNRTRVLNRYKVANPPHVQHDFVTSFRTRKGLTIFGVLLVRGKKRQMESARMRIQVAGRVLKPVMFLGGGIKLPFVRSRVLPYAVRIPLELVERLSIHTALYFVHVDEKRRWVREQLQYSRLRQNRIHCRGRLHSLSEGQSTVYVRQSSANSMFITVRVRNVTDSALVAPKIALASLAAKFRRHPTMLLFEKQSSHYEESASVLFEKMVDLGRRDVRFVLTRDQLHLVPEKYRRYVVPAFSFRHYYHFFCTHVFLGTETVQHAAELRTSDRRILRRIAKGDFGHVFLQHGVMYMVALSSRQRRTFRAGNGLYPVGTKIVCSSQLEAAHFHELGGFPREDLYVTGLPKFDRAYREDGADRILIMPTWRPWDHNIVRTDTKSAPYYHMLIEILEAVPDHLKDRAFLLPHPLVRPALVGTELEAHMWTGSYDEALRQCALLITDYSSISYDAFYRGANVIFWWKEKDECMRRYGGHLMLDEDSAFAPVAYEADELARAIEELVDAPQVEEYVRRYRRLVEFHDNRNTERLMAALERDGLI